MGRAEDRALKAYPIAMSQHSDNCKEYDSNESDRLTFIEGYHQAEKDIRFDLIHKMQECKEKIESGFSNDIEIDIQDFKTEKNFELTWEDIERIDGIILRLDASEESRGMCNQEYYQEVLKRFKEGKG